MIEHDWKARTKIRDWDISGQRACSCIGPQRGQPLCPCMMRGVQEVDGRYVRIEDIGPVPGYQKPDDFAYLRDYEGE
jgi:hypothetical protein